MIVIIGSQLLSYPPTHMEYVNNVHVMVYNTPLIILTPSFSVVATSMLNILVEMFRKF